MTTFSSSSNPRGTSASGAPSAGKPRKTGKTAILVIHGIGEQNPYETLDSFAQGFALYFNKLNPKNKAQLHPERLRHKDWTQVCVHLEFEKDATPNGLRQLSLFEFYWAPYTEGKMTYRGVLGWLARTSLTPLRYLTDNLQMRIDTSPSLFFLGVRPLALPERSEILRIYRAPLALNEKSFFAVQGRAFGEKKPMGKSREVRRPAGASRITGIELTTTDAVAMSPCEPPGITRLMLGCPVSEIVSTGSFAPT
jgi:hypothetical protein